MKKAWLKIKNGFLSYSRADRAGIIILVFVLLVFLGVKGYIKSLTPEPYYTKEQFDDIQLKWETILHDNEKASKKELTLFRFNPNSVTKIMLDSLDLPSPIKSNLIKYRSAGGSFTSKSDVRKLYGMTDSLFKLISPFIVIPKNKPQLLTKKEDSSAIKAIEGFFDPNQASINELKQYGLNTFQAKNIVSYRNSGGSYRQPEDLLKIYGLDSTTYKRIFPYLKIEVVEKPKTLIPEEFIKIELNSADTTDLIKLRGIGSVFASRIIKYRNLLGGFYESRQLMEVYGFTEEMFASVKIFVTIDTTKIERIRINYAEFAEIIRHPYFNKSNVNAILNEKDKNGPIRNLSELKELESIDGEFFKKVKPYINCR